MMDLYELLNSILTQYVLTEILNAGLGITTFTLLKDFSISSTTGEELLIDYIL